jgi:RNA polymerase sigma factor (sigma-70 family)
MERKIIDGIMMTEAECLDKYSYLIRVIVAKMRFKADRVIEPDDLYNVGAIGLMKAYRGFDPGHGAKFKSYCEVMVRGTIFHFLRDDKPISYGRQIEEKSLPGRLIKMAITICPLQFLPRGMQCLIRSHLEQHPSCRG